MSQSYLSMSITGSPQQVFASSLTTNYYLLPLVASRGPDADATGLQHCSTSTIPIQVKISPPGYTLIRLMLTQTSFDLSS
ncbi:hypothetical protein ACP70R_007849 [Stipagrostis hirtigluma subsp. patula]